MDEFMLKIILFFVLTVSLILYSICYYNINLIEEYNTLESVDNLIEQDTDILNNVKNPNNTVRYVTADNYKYNIEKIKVFLNSLFTMVASALLILCIFVGIIIFLLQNYFPFKDQPSLFDSHVLANSYIGDSSSRGMYF